MGYEGMDCTRLAGVKDQWLEFAKTVTNRKARGIS